MRPSNRLGDTVNNNVCRIYCSPVWGCAINRSLDSTVRSLHRFVDTSTNTLRRLYRSHFWDAHEKHMPWDSYSCSGIIPFKMVLHVFNDHYFALTLEQMFKLGCETVTPFRGHFKQRILPNLAFPMCGCGFNKCFLPWPWDRYSCPRYRRKRFCMIVTPLFWIGSCTDI